jgi:hypothetical protein
MVVPLDVSA